MSNLTTQGYALHNGVSISIYPIKQTDTCEDFEVQRTNFNLNQKRTCYLSIDTAQKMILRFLDEKNMPKEKLAEALKITVNDLEQLIFKRKKSSLVLIPKINLSLIKLYCSTNFNKPSLQNPILAETKLAKARRLYAANNSVYILRKTCDQTIKQLRIS